LTLKSLSWKHPPINNKDEQAKIKRESRRIIHYIEDPGRNREAIFDIMQKNETGLYELIIHEIATKTYRLEEVQLTDNVEGAIDNDSSIIIQERQDIVEDHSLLSLPILDENRSWTDAYFDESPDEDGNDNNNKSNINDAVNDDENLYEMGEDIEEIKEKRNGVKERFKAMISESLGEEHCDREEFMYMSADTNKVKTFAEEVVDGLTINEDLKLNLQEALDKYGLKFKITIAKKKNQVVKGVQLSIQQLIYLSEKRKKKAEINIGKWTMAEKMEYQTWISKCFGSSKKIWMKLKKHALR